ncbi:MAG: methylglyoxal synthase [Candidatus Onthovivens sp.]|nr:methylglyoxal synthase [Candidatus Onthovivens sp.]
MRVGLIAHDKEKPNMISLCIRFKSALAPHELVATGTTGKLIHEATGLEVKCMKSGPLGGDQQIGSMIADSQLDLVIFLRDPLTAQPHEPDVNALLRLCDVTNTPLATNKGSAVIMLEALLKNEIPCRKPSHL